MAPITNPAEPLFVSGSWGWDGSTWRKLALLFGYSEQLFLAHSETLDTAGDKIYLFDAVPAGELWIVQHVAAAASTNTTYGITFSVAYSSAVYHFYSSTYTNAGLQVSCHYDVVLPPGAQLRVAWYSAAAGDTVYAYALGYKMKIEE